MEDGAGDAIAPCPACADPSLVQYEELQGGFVCAGCGAVLSQLMVTERPSTRSDADKGVQLGGSFVGAHAATAPFLSAEARRSSRRSSFGAAPHACHQRRRLHRLCQQLGLPASATDQALALATASASRRLPAEVACVYTICRRYGRAVTFSDACAAASVSRRQAGRCLRRLHAEGATASGPERFVRRAVAALGASFDDEKRSMALLQCSEPWRSAAQHPDLTAYAAVAIAASARMPPSAAVLADRLGVKTRPLQDRIVQMKKAVLALGKVLPLGVVLTLGNVHRYYGLILDHLPLLADLHRRPPTDSDARVRDYEDAIARFGPRTETEPPSPCTTSGSDVESMSDGEAGRYVRSESEVRDLVRLQARIENPFTSRGGG